MPIFAVKEILCDANFVCVDFLRYKLRDTFFSKRI
jgi:hypothetical protein